MRNILISFLSAFFLLLIALAAVPLFVSTEFLKNQVEQIVKDQTGMSLDIQGDVAFSLFTGFNLSAETVSLRDASDKPLIAIDRLDFALALSPLLSGKADITGITLNKPVLTLNGDLPIPNRTRARLRSRPSLQAQPKLPAAKLTSRRSSSVA